MVAVETMAAMVPSLSDYAKVGLLHELNDCLFIVTDAVSIHA
jgi:hypothetical protein